MIKFQKLYLILFCIILVIAIFLRFYQLGVNPPSLDWDEASLGYNAYSILKTGADEYGNKLPLSIRSFDDYKPPVYVYLTIPSIAMFGLNEFSVRLPSAIIGVLGVIVVYFVALQLFESWDKSKAQIIALTVMFFMAISPWQLQFSRAAFEGNIGLTFFLLGLLFFLFGLKKGVYFIISATFIVFSLYSYHSFRLFIPLFLLSLLVIYWKEIKKRLSMFIVAALILFICSLPVYIGFLFPQGTGSRLSMVTIFSDPQLIQKSVDRSTYDKQTGNGIWILFHNRRVMYSLAVVKGYFDHFNLDFLFLHGDGGVQHHAVDMGMLYLWELPFLLIGIYILINKRNKEVILPFLILTLAPLPAAITSGTPHPVRAIAMIPALHIFTAVGFVFAGYFLLQHSNIFKKAIFSLIIIALFLNITYYLHQYYIHTPIEYGYFWQYGYKEVMQYAKIHEQQYKKIVITYAYDQPYVYYLFYNKIDPVWYQQVWNYSKTGELDRFYRIIGKYEFKKINYGVDSKQQQTLFIGTSDEIPSSAHVLKEIFFPDGRLAFRIVQT